MPLHRSTLRLLLSLLAPLALAADTFRGNEFVIYFLGSERPTAIRAHITYLKTLEKFEPALRASLIVKYIKLPPHDADYSTPLRRIANDKPNMVIAVNGMYALAARHAFPNTPVVFSSYDDPVQYGIVTNMHSRREPAAGISLTDTLDGKRLEILAQAHPKIRHVAVVADQQWADVMNGRSRTEIAADQLGLKASIIVAENRAQIKNILAGIHSNQYDAWYIPATPVTDHSPDILIKQFQTWQKPSIWTSRTEVALGAPMAYYQETSFVWRGLVSLTSRIHGGEYPGNIPILRPTHFTLAVRVEKESPIPPPEPAIVRRADYVIR